MAERTNDEVIHAYLRALTDNDAGTLASLRDSAWTLDYPQSGERIRDTPTSGRSPTTTRVGSPTSMPVGSSAARTPGW